MILLSILLSCFFVVWPLAGEVGGGDFTDLSPDSYRVVDLVASGSEHSGVCPETSMGISEDDFPCLITGVVNEIRVAPKRITVLVANEEFHYLVGENVLWEMGGPMNLFMASKINQLPVSIRFQNWGGVFYVTQASL